MGLHTFIGHYPKTYFLMAILPFSAMCLLVKTACVYTIAVYIYALSPCI